MDRPFLCAAVDANNIRNRQWKRQFTSQSQSERANLTKRRNGTGNGNSGAVEMSFAAGYQIFVQYYYAFIQG